MKDKEIIDKRFKWVEFDRDKYNKEDKDRNDCKY
jgi:hypothetical protein